MFGHELLPVLPDALPFWTPLLCFTPVGASPLRLLPLSMSIAT